MVSIAESNYGVPMSELLETVDNDDDSLRFAELLEPGLDIAAAAEFVDAMGPKKPSKEKDPDDSTDCDLLSEVEAAGPLPAPKPSANKISAGPSASDLLGAALSASAPGAAVPAAGSPASSAGSSPHEKATDFSKIRDVLGDKFRWSN